MGEGLSGGRPFGHAVASRSNAAGRARPPTRPRGPGSFPGGVQPANQRFLGACPTRLREDRCRLGLANRCEPALYRFRGRRSGRGCRGGSRAKARGTAAARVPRLPRSAAADGGVTGLVTKTVNHATGKVAAGHSRGPGARGPAGRPPGHPRGEGRHPGRRSNSGRHDGRGQAGHADRRREGCTGRADGHRHHEQRDPDGPERAIATARRRHRVRRRSSGTWGQRWPPPIAQRGRPRRRSRRRSTPSPGSARAPARPTSSAPRSARFSIRRLGSARRSARCSIQRVASAPLSARCLGSNGGLGAALGSVLGLEGPLDPVGSLIRGIGLGGSGDLAAAATAERSRRAGPPDRPAHALSRPGRRAPAWARCSYPAAESLTRGPRARLGRRRSHRLGRPLRAAWRARSWLSHPRRWPTGRPTRPRPRRSLSFHPCPPAAP